MASYKLALHSLSFSVLPFSPLYTHTHSDKHLASIWPEQMELVCFADRLYFSSFLRGSCISDCMTEGISNLVRLSQAVVYRRKQISRFPHSKVLTGEKERKNIMQQKKSASYIRYPESLFAKVSLAQTFFGLTVTSLVILCLAKAFSSFGIQMYCCRSVIFISFDKQFGKLEVQS